MWIPRVPWRQKAAIQRAVAYLPAPIGGRLYYALQRTVGGLSHVDPEERFRAALEMVQRLEAQGCSLVGGTVLELGTGWRLNVPLGLWLLGAQRVVTVDIHRYLRLALVRNDLAALRAAPERFVTLFGHHAASSRFCRRFDQLLAFRQVMPPPLHSAALATETLSRLAKEQLQQLPGLVAAASPASSIWRPPTRLDSRLRIRASMRTCRSRCSSTSRPTR